MKKNAIENEKINIVIENKARSIDRFSFNNETINFLQMLKHEYLNLCKQEHKSIEDITIYQKLLEIIENECGYCYKLTRDIENTIINMKNGVYRELDIIEIANDMIYIDYIISSSQIEHR